MSGPRFLDTNVLLYSIGRTPSERVKRSKALAILDEGNCALSVQVLHEFYFQATRETRADRISHELAVNLIEGWSRFPVQDHTLSVTRSALAVRATHGFSIWDCLIIAAARALGCEEVLTEDMQHGQVVAGVGIVNPFV